MTRIYYPQNTEIAYLEADINYTIFHLKDGKKIVSSTTLKKHEEEYSRFDFLRINKSSLVNPTYIKTVEKKGKKAKITLLSGTEITVSRRKISLINIIETQIKFHE